MAMVSSYSHFAIFFSFISAVLLGLAQQTSAARTKTNPLLTPSWARAHEREESRGLSESLKEAFGSEHREAMHARVENLKVKLQPLFASLPKNAYGRLEDATARFGLHRYFVREYAAYLKGLEPVGGAWKASPIASLESRVPACVQGQFQKHVENRGYELLEFASLGAMLELLIHRDAVAWLEDAYAAAGHGTKELISLARFDFVLDVFTWLFLGKPAHPAAWSIEAIMQDVDLYFPDWPLFQAHMREAKSQVLAKLHKAKELNFTDASKVVGVFVDGLGKLQQSQCNALTDSLIEMEVANSGRVKLSDFYSKGHLYNEKPELLLEMGALDPTSDGYKRKEPRVIIPNYVTSASNCITTSKFFAICCPDACDGLMTQLEREIAAPLASPEKLLKLVTAMPSRTQPGRNELPAYLRSRIQDISDHHGGLVPLHGRLFAQWMHHAFPHECVFPSRPGNVSRQTLGQMFNSMGPETLFSLEEQARFINNVKDRDLEGGSLEDTLPWLAEESVFAHVQSKDIFEELALLGRSCAFLAALAAVVHLMLRTITASPAVRGASAKLV